MVNSEASIGAQMGRTILGLLLLIIPVPLTETGRAGKRCQGKYETNMDLAYLGLCNKLDKS